MCVGEPNAENQGSTFTLYSSGVPHRTVAFFGLSQIGLTARAPVVHAPGQNGGWSLLQIGPSTLFCPGNQFLVVQRTEVPVTLFSQADMRTIGSQCQKEADLFS